ncbi:MAG: hypothetical protein OXU64_02485 [Gemmatimonadota bacterium]|nr:hypothetical protein [Gemmatimonadota bacterium]
MRLLQPGRFFGPLVPTFGMYTVALVLGSCGVGDARELATTFSVSASIKPVWPHSSPLPSVVVDSAQPPRLAIYLDLSSPMSGFVPPPGEPAAGVVGGELRTVAQWIPDHLGRVYPGVPLQWHGVAESVETLPQYPVFRREIFTGTESRLSLAIEEVLMDLRTGRAQGGAIITDLVGTGELTGALDVARYLVPWLASAERREGDFHFGLIGVRGTYWGAFHRTRCPPADGRLGCWYSERMPGWKPRLQAPVGVPFYVLLFGHSAEALNEIAGAVQRDADSQEIEAVWELLTAAGNEQPRAEVAFEALPEGGEPGEQQYALWRDAGDGTYGCYTGDNVELWGTFARASRFGPTEASLAPGSGGMPSPFTLELDGERLVVRVDCDAVRQSVRQSDSAPALHLNIGGLMQPPARPRWDEWSTPDDNTAEHPGSTLQLRYFVEETRVEPTSYRVDLRILTDGPS